jgi:outer membrane protein insertion porin family
VESLIGNKLDLNFIVKETEKSFIQRINVLGNNITRENVIRNQFEIDEGDFYNEILYNKTINNLKSLNFFKTVEGKVSTDDDTNDKILDIYLEEKPTGEIGASAGVGTSGNSIGVFVKENNYLGKGLGLESNLTLGTDSIKGLISINNPNFNDTDKSVYATLESY